MIDSMIDPTPLWIAAGLAFGLLAIYVRAISRRRYPCWTWLTFLGLGGLIFASINSVTRLPESNGQVALELVAIAMIVALGVVLFWFSTIYVQLVDYQRN